MADTMRTSSPALSRGPSAGRPSDPITDIGAELIAAIRDSATLLIEQQKDRAANEIAALGEVLRLSAQSLDQRDGRIVPRYADEAGRQIGDFADRLRHRSLGELTGGLDEFARRWPAVFLASAIGAGVFAGRFVVASAARPVEQEMPQSSPPPPPAAPPAGGARQDDAAVVAAVSSGVPADDGGTAARERG